jgi:hypothetical protein
MRECPTGSEDIEKSCKCYSQQKDVLLQPGNMHESTDGLEYSTLAVAAGYSLVLLTPPGVFKILAKLS